MSIVNGSSQFEWAHHLSVDGRLCLFVGAGVSAGCRTQKGDAPATWEALIDELAAEFEVTDLDETLTLLEKAELIDRARKAAAITDDQFSRIVATKVDFIDGEYVQKSKVHETIADIEPNLIITTNYDRVLERYLNESDDVGFNVWSYPGRVDQITARSQCSPEDELGDFIRSGSPLIVKLHGGVPDIGPHETPSATDHGNSDLVFSYRSYREAYSPSSEIPAFLRSIFVNFQVVFIGYSLRDEVLKDILDSVGSLKGNRFRHIVLQKDDSVVPEVYREAFEESYGVIVGNYPDHGLLAAALHGIKLARWRK